MLKGKNGIGMVTWKLCPYRWKREGKKCFPLFLKMVCFLNNSAYGQLTACTAVSRNLLSRLAEEVE